MRSGPLRAGAAALLFTGLAALLFPRALTGEGAFFHYDTWMQNFTFRAWWFEQLRAGTFATWCPGMFAGFPLFTQGYLFNVGGSGQMTNAVDLILGYD